MFGATGTIALWAPASTLMTETHLWQAVLVNSRQQETLNCSRLNPPQPMRNMPQPQTHVRIVQSVKQASCSSQRHPAQGLHLHVSSRTQAQLPESSTWYEERHVSIGAWKSHTKPISSASSCLAHSPDRATMRRGFELKNQVLVPESRPRSPNIPCSRSSCLAHSHPNKATTCRGLTLEKPSPNP